MQITEFLTPDCTLCGITGGSKKRLFETIAQFAGELNVELDPEDVFDGLLTRERLGSTGIGDGVAIPHCRLPECDKTIGILMTLEQPIDYDSMDGTPVDLVFTLLVPENEANTHLEALKAIAEKFSQPLFRSALREATENQILYDRATSA